MPTQLSSQYSLIHSFLPNFLLCVFSREASCMADVECRAWSLNRTMQILWLNFLLFSEFFGLLRQTSFQFLQVFMLFSSWGKHASIFHCTCKSEIKKCSLKRFWKWLFWNHGSKVGAVFTSAPRHTETQRYSQKIVSTPLVIIYTTGHCTISFLKI